ncbi:MAG: hypothetical protein WAX77_14010 [Methylococcaceae bacterium]
MFDWIKKSKNKKQAGIVTNVHDVKEQSHAKVQNIVAEQINDSFNKNIEAENYIEGNVSNSNIAHTITIHSQVINYYSEKENREIQILVNVYHLPKPTVALIGRKTELTQLTEAIKNNKRLAIIVAAGGIGKSALTDEWLVQIAQEKYYGKTHVFGWSFYSQGSHNTFTNSQAFFTAALTFFKKEIPKDEFEKAKRLAECLQQYPSLLILDGLEPLQYSEDLKVMNGELQDKPLATFLSQLRFNSCNSFILLSSRQALVELNKWQADNYLSLPLKTLPHNDGAELLVSLGVTGNEQQRQAISIDLNGHALSLVLMGHLLKEYHDGDYRYAKELPQLTTAHDNSDAEKDSRHALRVLDYYDSLQDEASRCFLQLLGLFDRPMNAQEKRELINKANHAKPLRNLTESEWKKVEQRLEKNGLLLGKKASFGYLEWDTHPIIRNYFGLKFKENNYEEFKQAHLVLFEYYQGIPEKEFPDTLDEMLPLYQAVVHGCLAGEYEQAISENYFRRITRGYYFSERYLGAYSNDLSILQIAILEINNEKIVEIPETAITNILATISSCLMSLGRLYDAITYTEDIIKRYSNFNDGATLHCIAVSYQNLVDIYFALGKLDLAKRTAKQSIEYSQLSKNYDYEIIGRNYVATTHYFYGKLEESERTFKDAINASFSTQRKYISEYTMIISDRYFELLIVCAKNKVARKEILAKYLEKVEQTKYNSGLYPSANECLVLALCCVASGNEDTELFFNDAIIQVHKSNTILFIPEFYLYRADFYLTQNRLNEAKDDLNSALEIIERCGMKLYQVDYCLIHGRYCLAINDNDTALNHYYEAQNLIAETGYHLRDAELYLLAAHICQHTNQDLNSKNADDYLQKAKNRIKEIGQWGLLRVIERDFPTQ